ncbi:MAG: aminopeptidase [Deltaproteobacteria bacterium]|nr:MAG: aminopeptidase [Deltaproteobacteria bacterium]RLB09047.1 MAG: aminopeptidase [Deltaproteobacteria bacterium]
MAKKSSPRKDFEQLTEKLFWERKLVWDCVSTEEKDAIFSFAERYKSFLDQSKTERECVKSIVSLAKEKGFVPWKEAREKGSRKVYWVHQDKTVYLAVMGNNDVLDGLAIIASHHDSPRLDLKQNPLYEEVDLVFLKTHYYGGIKKYQWLARPLALHGKVILQDGTELEFRIGEDESDPVFTIADLLPHLARKIQGEKKVSEAFEGEKLNLLVGSIPLGDSKVKERFKLAIINYLNEKYGMTEEDFSSAELEVVPAGKAKDLGFDRSLVGAYGHDDRSSVYTSLEAIMELEEVQRTALACFYDKEEIGSEGSTGAKSRFFELVISNILELQGKEANVSNILEVLANSRAISADVNGALDPDYQEVHEKRNAARIGYGICVTKFTGSGGKYHSSDAHAEYLAWLRRLFNRNNVVWQTGELGKIDEGGGGTIAKFLASYGMNIVDCGTPLLSMHSPFEIASKADLYMTKKAFKVFWKGDS